MPSAAIAATAVDLILPVEQMAERIANLPFLAAEPAAPDDADDEADGAAGCAGADRRPEAG